MEFKTTSGPFIAPYHRLNILMFQVIIALLPAISVMSYFLGLGVIIQLLLTSLTAILSEILCLRLRRKPVISTLLDGSALLSALLLGLAIPMFAPWWLSVSGTAFAIIIAKHLYGGLGYNPFNPAMVGYVFLLISFPAYMTRWPLFTNALEIEQAFFYIFSSEVLADTLTGATFLDASKNQLSLPLSSAIKINATSLLALAYLIGGVYLLVAKVIRWQIPLGVLVGLSLPASLFYLLDAHYYHSPWQHLIFGASFIGAFFIATDPVTACASQRTRWYYGLLIGVLIYIIRTWGSYPDGVAFAVLLANIAAPTLDILFKPKSKKYL